MLSEQGWQTKTANIRGLKTAWIECGKLGDPVVILCHGFPDSPEAWSSQITMLKTRYHVIAPFVRGCDQSEAAHDLQRYGSNAVLLDHLAILEACAVVQGAKIFVVGHDLGAAHALNLARALGHRLAGCVVINGGDVGMFARRLNSPRQLAKSWYMAVMQLPKLPELLVKYMPESCFWLASSMGGLNREYRDSSNFARRSLAPLNQYRAFAKELPKALRARTSRLKAPLLVLFGRDDGFLEHPSLLEWNAIGLDVTIRILPGGHWIHRDNPELVNSLLLDFIETPKKRNLTGTEYFGKLMDDSQNNIGQLLEARK
ncbi:MAG: alpha/beta hydrolase [Proteobacteria bacterium]|nr:alpha/beta hydrolase [Pseudomonadota bacterium]